MKKSKRSFQQKLQKRYILKMEIEGRQLIDIFVSCRSLAKMDVFSQSDPFVKFFIQEQGKKTWTHKGTTEVINDNANPNFFTAFQTEYIFEMKQPCRFEVYDDDGQSADFIGAVETTIGKLMGAKDQLTILDLLGNGQKHTGKLITRCDTIKDGNHFVQMRWVGVKLMNTDGWFFDKSDPFLRISKYRDEKAIQKIFETEVIMDNLNPKWKPFKLNLNRLCNGDHNKKFKIECWDWEKSGIFQFIGEMSVSINDLLAKKDFPLYNKNHKNPGTLRLEEIKIVQEYNFLNFIRGGLQLNLNLSIDFTGSNGLPRFPESLHYLNPAQLNQYQMAIMTIGEILIAYDYDQRVPCYGFGASLNYPNMKTGSTVSHCFPLSGEPNNIEAFGLSNIMELYNYALQYLNFSGPTYFAPIIKEAMAQARQIKQTEQNLNFLSKAYIIHLILTDGEIHDMSETIECIVDSSHLPLSLIIVGIGQADFGNMDTLDGDNGLIGRSGRKAVRDLVQFVPFRNFKGDTAALAQHVLQEIPDQVTEYHKLIGKSPGQEVVVNLQEYILRNQSRSGSMQQQAPASGYSTSSSQRSPSFNQYPPNQPNQYQQQISQFNQQPQIPIGMPPQIPGNHPQYPGYPVPPGYAQPQGYQQPQVYQQPQIYQQPFQSQGVFQPQQAYQPQQPYAQGIYVPPQNLEASFVGNPMMDSQQPQTDSQKYKYP